MAGREHTCHDMNPPFPGPCAACEMERREQLNYFCPACSQALIRNVPHGLTDSRLVAIEKALSHHLYYDGDIGADIRWLVSRLREQIAMDDYLLDRLADRTNESLRSIQLPGSPEGETP